MLGEKKTCIIQLFTHTKGEGGLARFWIVRAEAYNQPPNKRNIHIQDSHLFGPNRRGETATNRPRIKHTSEK